MFEVLSIIADDKAPATALTAPGYGRTNEEFDMSDGTSEEWRPIHGYEGLYEVSSLGAVRSLDRVLSNGYPRSGRVLKQRKGSGGYLSVTLAWAQTNQQSNVHVLVCRAFHGEKPAPKHEVRHLNGNPADNRAENLSWGTRSENHHDTVRHGRHHLASKTHCKRGHEFTDENTRRSKNGGRFCRACARLAKAELKTGPIPDRVHGSWTGYCQYGCRCDACLTAGRAYSLAAYHRQKAARNKRAAG